MNPELPTRPDAETPDAAELLTARKRRQVTAEHLKALQQIGKLPNFNPPSKHAAGRVGKKRPKRRNRRKP
jgi:hypothetical protein